MAVQNFNYIPLGAYVDFATGYVYPEVQFTDSDDNVPAGSNRYTCPVTGPIQDSKGRIVAAGTPANIISSGASLKTTVLSALAAGAAAQKLKP